MNQSWTEKKRREEREREIEQNKREERRERYFEALWKERTYKAYIEGGVKFDGYDNTCDGNLDGYDGTKINKTVNAFSF